MNTAEKQKLQALINVLIEQELHEQQQVLEEGMADVIKASWEKTKGAVVQGWDAVKAQFTNSTKKILGEAQKTLASIKNAYPALKAEYDAIVKAGQQAGTPIKLTGPLQEAASLSKEAQSVYAAVVADAEKTKQLGAQAAKQQTKQEAVRFQTLNSIVLETANKIQQPKTELIKESGAVATALASFGAVKLLLKFFSWMFSLFKNPAAAKVAEKLHSAYEGMHHVEEGILNTVLPDQAAYLFYAGQAKLRKKQPMPFKQFAKSDTAMKTKQYMYIALLTYLLINGIYHLFHAGWQALTAAHAGVEGTHAIEIGKAVVEIAQAAGQEGTAAAGAAAGMADMGDIVNTAVDIAVDVGTDSIGNAVTTTV